MSKIEWTGITVNPIRARDRETGKVGWHCEHVTEGCRNCYAERLNLRGIYGKVGTGLPYTPSEVRSGRVEVFLDDAVLLRVLRMKKPRLIFWNSMTDWMADFVPDWMRDRMLATIALTPQHTHICLTKRAAAQRKYMGPSAVGGFGRAGYVDGHGRKLYAKAFGGPFPLGKMLPFATLPNLWLGVSAEDQGTWDDRVPELLATPAAHRWVSLEPMLGAVDARAFLHDSYCTCGDLRRRGLETIVCGGESGRDARPMHPDHPRAVRDACAAAGVPFFFKQWGEWGPCERFSVPHPRPHFADLAMIRLPDGTEAHASAAWLDPHHGRIRALDLSAIVARVGKRAAGRLLDGRPHDDLGWRAAP